MGSVVTVLVFVLIAVILGIMLAAFLMFLVMRAVPSIFGEFVKSNKFVPVVNAIIVIAPAAAAWLSTRSLPFTVLTGVSAILPVVKEQTKLREVQEERRRDRPPETPAS